MICSVLLKETYYFAFTLNAHRCNLQWLFSASKCILTQIYEIQNAYKHQYLVLRSIDSINYFRKVYCSVKIILSWNDAGMNSS